MDTGNEMNEVQKSFSGYRVRNDSLRMVYFHDQTIAVVELGAKKLLLSCELIEIYNDADGSELLAKLASTVNRPLGIGFTEMLQLMTQCQTVDNVENLQLSSPISTYENEYDVYGDKAYGTKTFGDRTYDDSEFEEPKSSTSGKGPIRVRQSQQEHQQQKPQQKQQQQEQQEQQEQQDQQESRGFITTGPLSLFSGIVPGTKWCGTGDIATTYHDLGSDKDSDKCCRTHDLCPVKIRAFKQRYNLTNNSLYTKSHCLCDDLLFECLRNTKTPAAQLMGNIYFNLVRVPCVHDANDGQRQFRGARRGF
ncbi:SUN domain-containing protein 2-like [Ctenocephalides felis]|uniref:SUN domain-containing protein 2-like n=1 Tax=Ctenocephalides felis TaxID=7515 RepID=UPI000E6E3E9D|nr:SUN domain-containing protein 2-like [Ctenocephalides felis]XP_026477207.1 SUN domain-containing protein 2-like [Ctenocephalides felis]